MSMEVDISKWAGGLDQLRDKIVAAATQGVNLMAQQIISEAVELAPRGGGSHSPYDDAPGTLKDSGVAMPAELEGDVVVSAMGFNTAYAIYQHEALDWGHDEGEAKYLETPMRRNLARANDVIAGPIRNAMGGG
jgi:hypothetical protein